MKTVAITGSSGFVGTNLKSFFELKGFKVIAIKREELKNIDKLCQIIEEATIIINLAGANIVNRWTEKYKQILIDSRLETTKVLVQAMRKVDRKPELFISTSAVGIYKNKTCYDEENYDYEDDFLGNLCKKWENEALKVQDIGIRTIIFRFGIVLGYGGALEKMIKPFKFGLGGTIGDGSQFFSFIHIKDLIKAYEYVYENQVCLGIYNLTSPNPTTNYKLTKALGKALNRPTILPVPEFILNLIFNEGAKVLTDGQCVKPKRLIDSGFDFKFKSIDDAISSLV